MYFKEVLKTKSQLTQETFLRNNSDIEMKVIYLFISTEYLGSGIFEGRKEMSCIHYIP